ncbi:MAG: hypothetical protein RH917_05415 [Lacipirellulaceae bacterium]
MLALSAGIAAMMHLADTPDPRWKNYLLVKKESRQRRFTGVPVSY